MVEEHAHEKVVIASQMAEVEKRLAGMKEMNEKVNKAKLNEDMLMGQIDALKHELSLAKQKNSSQGSHSSYESQSRFRRYSSSSADSNHRYTRK
jgi:hypothetical protein